MFDIVQIVKKQQVLALQPLLEEYTRTMGKEDKNDNLLISIFTNFSIPDTLLLVAMKNDEPVGFLWARPVSQFDEIYLRISEIYARQGMMGMRLFEKAMEWADEHGFYAVKGLVRAEKAAAMKRLFKMKEEAVLISVEVGHG